jgi:hypothetical protein
MSTAQVQPDFDDPLSVVRAFIEAMNRWETESWLTERSFRTTGDPFSYQADVRARMDVIFSNFCIPRDRKYGRNGSFQKPPEYDPQHEKILETEVDEVRKRAHVTTHREAVLGGGRHRYTLVRRGGKWLIDTLKREQTGEWQSVIL